MSNKFCSSCGNAIGTGKNFCENCGVPVEGTNQNTQPNNIGNVQYANSAISGGMRTDGASDKSFIALIILWFFWGILGIHHFYAGNAGKGVLYLCTFGCLGIGWFIDFFLIVSGNYKDGLVRPINS